MVECIEDRHHAVDCEKCGQYQGEREHPAGRPADQNRTGDNRRQRRKERPDETGGMPAHERRDQAGPAVDQQEPAEEDRRREAGDGGQDNGARAQNNQHDTFEQEQPPVLADRLAGDGEPRKRPTG